MRFSITIKAIHDSGDVSIRREVVGSEMEEPDCILRAMEGTASSTMVATLAAMLLECEQSFYLGSQNPENAALYKAAADFLRPIPRYRKHYDLEEANTE